jgi:hypothetical protein
MPSCLPMSAPRLEFRHVVNTCVSVCASAHGARLHGRHRLGLRVCLYHDALLTGLRRICADVQHADRSCRGGDCRWNRGPLNATLAGLDGFLPAFPNGDRSFHAMLYSAGVGIWSTDLAYACPTRDQLSNPACQQGRTVSC